MNLIVAVTDTNGIGLNGKLPWRLRNDMKYFADCTTNYDKKSLPSACLMGRKTWESIPEKFRPLKDRLNIVMTRSPSKDTKSIKYCSSIEEAVEIAKGRTLWVIGGAEIYKLAQPYCDAVFVTRVSRPDSIECDTHLDLDLDVFSREESRNELLLKYPNGPQIEGDFTYEFQVYVRKT